MSPAAQHRGAVVAFDAAVGLGEVAGDGGERYPFHCTRIADGSRTIAVGTDVGWVVVPGRSGRWEAADVGPLRGDSSTR